MSELIRNNFEQWAESWGWGSEKDDEGYYEETTTQMAWNAWVEQSDRIAELEREKAELVAWVEALKPLARRCLWGAISWNDHNFEPLHKYCRESAKEAGIFTVDQANALLESPTQCLNQIKAEAVIEAIDAHKNNVLTFEFNTVIRTTDLIKYANQLRQQAKDSKL